MGTTIGRTDAPPETTAQWADSVEKWSYETVKGIFDQFSFDPVDFKNDVLTMVTDLSTKDIDEKYGTQPIPLTPEQVRLAIEGGLLHYVQNMKAGLLDQGSQNR